MMAGVESQVEKKLQRLLKNTTPVGGCLLYKFGKHKGVTDGITSPIPIQNLCLFPTLCFPTEHVQSGLIHGAKPKPLMYQHPYI